MNIKKAVLFENAFEVAVEQTRILGDVLSNEILLVRDLRGRIRVVLPGAQKNYTGAKQQHLNQYRTALSEALGSYGFPSEQAILFADDLAQGDKVMASSDRRLVSESNHLSIYLLDRQIIGHDWMRSPLERKTRNPRITFFGIKGGVGRSTALIIWAWQLAQKGKKVLVLDLDLESPGASSTLLPQEYLPDFGIVDWLVEDGVGQAEIVENAMISSSPLAKNLAGELLIVPAYGRETGDYLAKLSRCYAEFSSDRYLSWAERIQRLVEGLEQKEKPDLVFLDSRAGLHDIAAVLVTRLGAETLLFAVDSPQTWKAYSFLFHYWRNHPQLRIFRERLQIVAGMVPETEREKHLKKFTEHSWDVFRDNLYDEASPEDTDVFSFNLEDDEAPHSPLPIFWHRGLQEFNPTTSAGGLDAQIAREALGIFMDKADHLLTIVGEE